MSLSWNKFKELPQKRKHAQAVVHNDKVYIGSGYCESDELAHEVAAFCLKTNKWEELPRSDTRWFAMAIYENDLVLISGKYIDGKSCTRVAKLNKEDCKWMWPDDITEMKTARMGASAASIASHLLVAGGWDNTRNRVNTVEVYDKHKRQWFKAQPLPKMAAECKTALVDNDVWFFMGGANQEKAVFYASMQAIIKQAVPQIIENPNQNPGENSAQDEESDEGQQDMTTESDLVWKTLPDAPHEFCCAAVLGGTLVSIGGTGFLWNSKVIHAYNPHTNAWLKIGEMPEDRCRAVAVPLNDASILIIGGVDGKKRLSSIVSKCTLSG